MSRWECESARVCRWGWWESQVEEDEAGKESGVTSHEETVGDFNNVSFCNFYMVATLGSLSLHCLFNKYTDSFPGFCFSLFDKVSLLFDSNDNYTFSAAFYEVGLGFLSIFYSTSLTDTH